VGSRDKHQEIKTLITFNGNLATPLDDPDVDFVRLHGRQDNFARLCTDNEGVFRFDQEPLGGNLPIGTYQLIVHARDNVRVFMDTFFVGGENTRIWGYSLENISSFLFMVSILE